MKRYLNKTLQSFSKTNLEITVVILFVVIFFGTCTHSFADLPCLSLPIVPSLFRLPVNFIPNRFMQKRIGLQFFFLFTMISKQKQIIEIGSKKICSAAYFLPALLFSVCKNITTPNANTSDIDILIVITYTLSKHSHDRRIEKKKTSTTGEMGNEAHFIF